MQKSFPFSLFLVLFSSTPSYTLSGGWLQAQIDEFPWTENPLSSIVSNSFNISRVDVRRFMNKVDS